MSIQRLMSATNTPAEQVTLAVASNLGLQHSSITDPDSCVFQSDATVIITRHRALSADLRRLEKLATSHRKPLLHIHAQHHLPLLLQAKSLCGFISAHSVSDLNVITSGDDEDNPDFQDDIRSLLETAIALDALSDAPAEANFHDHPTEEYTEVLPLPPRTVDDAVGRLLLMISLRNRTEIAKLELHEVDRLHIGLGMWIRENFKLWGENESLLEDCRVIAQRDTLDADGAALVIIASLWERLRESHRLRVVE